jgi:hypothetical protein
LSRWGEAERSIVTSSLLKHPSQTRRVSNILSFTGLDANQVSGYIAQIQANFPTFTCSEIRGDCPYVEAECCEKGCSSFAPDVDNEMQTAVRIPFQHGFLAMLKSGLYYVTDTQRMQVVAKNIDILKVIRDIQEDQIFYELAVDFHNGILIAQRDLERELKPYCVYSKVYGDAVRKFFIETPSKIINGTRDIGFGDNGWQIPPKVYCYGNTTYQKDLKASLEKNFNVTQPIPKELEEMMVDTWRKAYRAIKVDYRIRDALVCLGSSAPFFSQIRKYKDYMPIVFLMGGPYSGKSSLEKFAVSNCWKTGKELYNPDTFNSPARAPAILSLSTFPIVIDEAEGLPDFMLPFMKSYCTGEGSWTRMTSAIASVESTLRAPVFMNGNRIPLWMNDPAFADRLLLFKLDNPSIESDSLFSNAIDSLKLLSPVGRLIYDYTEKWSNADLLLKFEKIALKIGAGYKSDRRFIALVLFEMGREFIENVLRTPIKTTTLEFYDLIQKTSQLVTENLISQFREVAEIQRNYDPFVGRAKKKSPYWCSSKLVIQTVRNSEYCYFTHINNRDLAQFRGEKMSLPNLASQLMLAWGTKDVEYGNHSVNGKQRKSIKFPLTCLEVCDK